MAFKNVLAALMLAVFITSMCIAPLADAKGIKVGAAAYGTPEKSGASQAGNSNVPTIFGNGNVVFNNQTTYNIKLVVSDRTDTQTSYPTYSQPAPQYVATTQPAASYTPTYTPYAAATQPTYTPRTYQQRYTQPAATATYPAYNQPGYAARSSGFEILSLGITISSQRYWPNIPLNYAVFSLPGTSVYLESPSEYLANGANSRTPRGWVESSSGRYEIAYLAGRIVSMPGGSSGKTMFIVRPEIGSYDVIAEVAVSDIADQPGNLPLVSSISGVADQTATRMNVYI